MAQPKRCVVCTFESGDSAEVHSSSVFCPTCNAFLCLTTARNCYRRFHTDPDLFLPSNATTPDTTSNTSPTVITPDPNSTTCISNGTSNSGNSTNTDDTTHSSSIGSAEHWHGIPLPATPTTHRNDDSRHLNGDNVRRTNGSSNSEFEEITTIPPVARPGGGRMGKGARGQSPTAGTSERTSPRRGRRRARANSGAL